jgi:hypothetical protein
MTIVSGYDVQPTPMKKMGPPGQARWALLLYCAASAGQDTDEMTEPRQSESVEPAPRYDGPNQVHSLLLWVGIVAGVVFIVAVVFFSGFFIGRSSSGHFDNYDRDGAEHPGMMFPGQRGWYGPMGPGMMGPWGPGQQWPTPTTPTTPRP